MSPLSKVYACALKIASKAVFPQKWPVVPKVIHIILGVFFDTRGQRAYDYDNNNHNAKMIIHKLYVQGTSLVVALPAAFCYEAGLHTGDLVTVELWQKDEIIIRRVDLKALAKRKAKNAATKK